jgi:hypothetical protein
VYLVDLFTRFLHATNADKVIPLVQSKINHSLTADKFLQIFSSNDAYIPSTEPWQKELIELIACIFVEIPTGNNSTDLVDADEFIACLKAFSSFEGMFIDERKRLISAIKEL